MITYQNNNGNSGISAYEIGNNSITIQFKGAGKVYKYSYGKAGKNHVDNMKALAIAGAGLNSYLKRNVNDLFD